ncbi:hypothetical protein BDQ12DRAFT_740228 [Crucibulum laeve]|uniref:Uncharacterized protein n=1 Tax=Crucibulum laeve TaxID=68775 RepID=A0A5C3LDR7_9AGAR|nr:hypothetical protein BDQ12DRAFT_740228 [Crucibulum laeve]
MLNAKLPGTCKCVPGLGRITFSILYHLVDEFISAIDAHHDGWSYRASPTKSPTNPVKSPSSTSPFPTHHTHQLLLLLRNVATPPLMRALSSQFNKPKNFCSGTMPSSPPP